MNDCAILTAQLWQKKREKWMDLMTHSRGETKQLKGLKSLCAVQVLRRRKKDQGDEEIMCCS